MDEVKYIYISQLRSFVLIKDIEINKELLYTCEISGEHYKFYEATCYLGDEYIPLDKNYLSDFKISKTEDGWLCKEYIASKDDMDLRADYNFKEVLKTIPILVDENGDSKYILKFNNRSMAELYAKIL